MAQTVGVHLEDDLAGGPAKDTVTFELDGKNDELDLPTTNAQKLREARGPLCRRRPQSPRGGNTCGPGTRATKGEPDTVKIRAGAQDNGHEVSDRGRIHQCVKDASYAAPGRS